MQKRRHVIHRKSMVEVIYRKPRKSAGKLDESSNSSKESIPILDPNDQENNQAAENK